MLQVEMLVQRRFVMEQHIARHAAHVYIHVVLDTVMVQHGCHVVRLLLALVTLVDGRRGALAMLYGEMRQDFIPRD